jgi:hypothetical protein
MNGERGAELCETSGTFHYTVFTILNFQPEWFLRRNCCPLVRSSFVERNREVHVLHFYSQVAYHRLSCANYLLYDCVCREAQDRQRRQSFQKEGNEIPSEGLQNGKSPRASKSGDRPSLDEIFDVISSSDHPIPRMLETVPSREQLLHDEAGNSVTVSLHNLPPMVRGSKLKWYTFLEAETSGYLGRHAQSSQRKVAVLHKSLVRVIRLTTLRDFAG